MLSVSRGLLFFLCSLTAVQAEQFGPFRYLALEGTGKLRAGQEPWALKKTDPERMATVLYVTAEVIRQVAILAQPYTPGAAARLLDLLVVPDDARNFACLGTANRLPSGTDLPKPEGVFPRYVEDEQA